MSNIHYTTKYIGQLYDNLEYMDVYAGSVIGCVTLILLLVGYQTYVRMKMHIEPVRKNWAVERCKPQYMIFAGQIMQPKDIPYSTFTKNNMRYCFNKILDNITASFFYPIQYVLKPILSMWNLILYVIDMIRRVFYIIRNTIIRVSTLLMDKIINLLVPFQKVAIAMRDMIGKMQAIFVTILYQAIGAYYALRSFLGAILELTLIFIITLAAMIIIAWMMPWTWGWAAAMTAIFVAIVIPLAIMAGFLENVLNIRSRLSIPRKPRRPACFDGYNELNTKNRGRVLFKDLRLGDVLTDGSVVNALFEIDNRDRRYKIYELHGIRVTDCHYVMYQNKWIKVEEHPFARLISPIELLKYKVDTLYCVNTSKKRIIMDDCLFSDWDDIVGENEVNNLIKKVDGSWMYGHLKMVDTLNPTNLHKYFEGGFYPETLVKTIDTYKCICELEVGDRLSLTNQVLGKVVIDGSDIKQAEYDLGEDHTIKGSGNIVYWANDRNKRESTLTTYTLSNNLDNLQPRLYHLITTEGTFVVDKDLIVYDYDACLDFFE